MIQTAGAFFHPLNLRLKPLISIISLVLLLVVLGIVLFVALRSPLKDDIAWLLYVAHRWLDGQKLYIDVVEVNPPLIIWISAIPLEIAQWMNVDPKFVAVPVFISIILGCAWWTTSLLCQQGGVFSQRLPVFATIGCVLLILPASDLGQREHLLAAAFMPYLVILSRTLDGREAQTGNFCPIAAGVLAALGCALKPWYGGIFCVLECLAFAQGCRPWRPMPFAAAATLVFYAGLVAITCPAYLGRAVPMALALYGATDVPFLTLVSDSMLLLCGQVVLMTLLWLRWRRPTNHNLLLILTISAVTSTAVCFMDGKNWYYHRLPAMIMTVLALLLWSATEFLDQREHRRFPLVAALIALVVFGVSSVQRLEPEVTDALELKQTAVGRLEQILRAEHARTYIAFSEWIALGFPVVNETGVTWASRFDSMWALKGEVWRAQFDPAADKQWPIARWVAHDFIAGCPDVAVVDTRETTQYIKVLSAADPAFAAVWSRYHQIALFNGLVVYHRGKAGCLDVWAAANSKPKTD